PCGFPPHHHEPSSIEIPTTDFKPFVESLGLLVLIVAQVRRPQTLSDGRRFRLPTSISKPGWNC
ncbi:MAG: hypothetical protein P8R38_01965, partial [Planctomycetota bacterium]|nr:hypothetical protein [Planctomycetota bacterium]